MGYYLPTILLNNSLNDVGPFKFFIHPNIIGSDLLFKYSSYRLTERIKRKIDNSGRYRSIVTNSSDRWIAWINYLLMIVRGVIIFSYLSFNEIVAYGAMWERSDFSVWPSFENLFVSSCNAVDGKHDVFYLFYSFIPFKSRVTIELFRRIFLIRNISPNAYEKLSSMTGKEIQKNMFSF